MARKKRQYLQQEQTQEPVSAMLPSVWETAIYARLSVENSKKNDDGDSIEGQIEICRDYVAEHPYLHLADTYVDNGWTGTNTDRPEFQRLPSDIREGKIKALVIKDFSRFSRDYIEAGNLLENIFPAMGVRFISVVDRYDSFETDGSDSSLLIPLKNLINSFYSRDQSKKVSLAVHAKQLAGEHIPSMIPYGYRKSTTQEYRFEPDPETAPMQRQKHSPVIYYTCLKSVSNRETACPVGERFIEADLERIVKNDLLEKLRLLVDADDRLYAAAAASEGTEENLRFRLEQIEKRMKQISVSRVSAYERYAEGRLQRDIYLMERDKLNAENDSLSAEKERLEKELLTLSQSRNRELTETCDMARRTLTADELTNEMLRFFIDRVNVYSGMRVEIIYRFSDEIARLIGQENTAE